MSSKVYFTKDISPESLEKVYKALNLDITNGGKNKVGVKVSTGEDGAKGYLKPELIGPFVKSLNGTIIECNTAYPGARNTAEDHIEVAKNTASLAMLMLTLWTPKANLKSLHQKTAST